MRKQDGVGTVNWKCRQEDNFVYSINTYFLHDPINFLTWVVITCDLSKLDIFQLEGKTAKKFLTKMCPAVDALCGGVDGLQQQSFSIFPTFFHFCHCR